ncbi:MAG TPA: hypothetical protein VIS07_03675 [Candidatus Binatia bacterium]
MAAAPSFLQGTAYDQRSRDRARAPERAPFASALTPGAVLATAVLYAALTAWFLWPLPTAASSHLLYPTSSWELIDADADFALWAMAWTAHALVTDPLHLFDANVFYPMPRALALSDHMVGHQPVFAPVFLATGNPVLAGNVLLLFDFWLAAMGTFLLATRFMPASAAVVAGAAFGFVASRRANTFHLHVLAVGWMSLAMFFADRWLERARWRDGAPMAVALALQLLSSFYLAYMMLVGALCALVPLLWRWRERLDRRRVLGGFACCAAAALPFVALAIPYVLLRRDGYLPEYGTDGGQVGGLLPGVAQFVASRILFAQSAGVVAAALAVLGLLPPWRGRRTVLALALALVLGGWLVGRGPADLTLGPLAFPSPYRWLIEWVPGFSSMRVPDRILNVATLGLALLAGLGAARALRVVASRPRLAWLGGAALAVAIVAFPAERTELELHPRDVGERAPASPRWLAQHADGRALLELPPKTFRPAAARMLASTTHWLPLFDGYTSHPPPVRNYLAHRIADLPDPRALTTLLRETDVGWILVHGDELPPPLRKRWSSTAIPPELEHVATFGDERLFRVRAQGPMRPDSPLYDTARTPGGVPREPLGASCPGRLELVPRPPTEPLAPGAAVPAGELLRFTARITNDGDRPWPAGGLHPYRQVRLRACVGLPAGRGVSPCPEHEILLVEDVPAHGTVELEWAVVAPRVPADYVLWADLLQVTVGSLADCGVAPVEVPLRVVAAPEGARRSRRR